MPEEKNAGGAVAGSEVPGPEEPASAKTCVRCGGTGLVCAHVPEIGPGFCCADYGNAVCPDCKGSGTCGKEEPGS